MGCLLGQMNIQVGMTSRMVNVSFGVVAEIFVFVASPVGKRAEDAEVGFEVQVIHGSWSNCLNHSKTLSWVLVGFLGLVSEGLRPSFMGLMLVRCKISMLPVANLHQAIIPSVTNAWKLPNSSVRVLW